MESFLRNISVVLPLFCLICSEVYSQESAVPKNSVYVSVFSPFKSEKNPSTVSLVQKKLIEKLESGGFEAVESNESSLAGRLEEAKKTKLLFL